VYRRHVRALTQLIVGYICDTGRLAARIVASSPPSDSESKLKVTGSASTFDYKLLLSLSRIIPVSFDKDDDQVEEEIEAICKSASVTRFIDIVNAVKRDASPKPTRAEAAAVDKLLDVGGILRSFVGVMDRKPLAGPLADIKLGVRQCLIDWLID
jgi:hypothetical protein